MTLAGNHSGKVNRNECSVYAAPEIIGRGSAGPPWPLLRLSVLLPEELGVRKIQGRHSNCYMRIKWAPCETGGAAPPPRDPVADFCHNTTGSNVNQCGRLCGGVKLEQVRENVPYLVSRVTVGLTPMAPPSEQRALQRS